MASVFRKKVTKPLPAKAEVFLRKGDRIARWKDGRGRNRTAPVTTGRDGTDRIVIQAATYTAKYRDGQGVVREVATGCRTKDGALSVLRELTGRAEKVRAQIISPEEDRIADHQVTTLQEHIASYVDHQTVKGVHPARVDNTRSRLKRVATDCGLVRLGDVNAPALERWLLDRQNEKMSAGARNGYREAWIGFANWCVKTNRLLGNPLSNLPKADAKADCRRKRRALTEDELKRLLDAARRRPLQDALTIRRGPNKGKAMAKVSESRRVALERLGRERALIYKTYLLTGLRKSELASLTVAKLDLDGPTPFAVLDPSDEKSRRGADIPLRPDLAAELRQWLDVRLSDMQAAAKSAGEPIPTELPPDLPIFDIPDGLRRILDRDLEFAGIPKKDDRGRTVDIHALRHTFGTHLSKAGVAPRVAQAAMRHSSIDLTMNVYTDPRLLDVHAALDSLPELSLTKPSEEKTVEATATGTDGVGATGFEPATSASRTQRSTRLSHAPMLVFLLATELSCTGHPEMLPVTTLDRKERILHSRPHAGNVAKLSSRQGRARSLASRPGATRHSGGHGIR
jgi:integrase